MRYWPILLTLTLTLCCATTPPKRPVSWSLDSGARIKDSAPERLAAERDANSDLDPEAGGRRWGFDAARARKRQKADDAQRAKTDQESGPVDLRNESPPQMR
jgi:hypothetical protein